MNNSVENSNINSMWSYIDGEIVATRDAKISVNTQSFNYGTGVFEGIRAYKSDDGNSLNIFRLKDHLSRLQTSADILRMNIDYTLEELIDITKKLLQKSQDLKDSYIRPIVFKKALLPGAKFGVQLSGVSSSIVISSLPMGSYVKQTGLKCTVSNLRRLPNIALPVQAKITGAYVNNALAMDFAQSNGFDDAILLDISGYLAEATTSNVFIVRNDEIITPPVNADILAGITRESIISIAKKEFNKEVIERNIQLSELYLADECFLTGTGVEVVPVIEIDNRPIGNGDIGKVTTRLRDTYTDVVRDKRTEYKDWLTCVY